MRWFRFYEEALNDPKVQMLDGETFKGWVNILCIASTCDGTLPSAKDMSFRMRMSDVTCDGLVQKLVTAGLLDVTKKGIRPHNWDSRQFKSDSSAERMRKLRERKRTADSDDSSPPVTGDDDVTSQVTPPEQRQNRAETEQSRENVYAQNGDSKSVKKSKLIPEGDKTVGPIMATEHEPSGFAQFWQAYPKKVSKDAARKAWVKLKLSQHSEQVLESLERWKASKGWKKNGGEFIPYPATWLNRNDWADEELTTDTGPRQLRGMTGAGLSLMKKMEESENGHEGETSQHAQKLLESA